MSDHTVFVFQVAGDIIFDFDIVVLADGCEPGYPLGHADEPLVQVQIMGTLVQEHPAAFTFPGGAPAAVVVVTLGAEPVGDNPGGAL